MDITVLAYLEPEDPAPDVVVQQVAEGLAECGHKTSVLTIRHDLNELIAGLKAQAMPADVMHSVFADRFRTWHGVASIAYLLQSLLGVALVLKSGR